MVPIFRMRLGVINVCLIERSRVCTYMWCYWQCVNIPKNLIESSCTYALRLSILPPFLRFPIIYWTYSSSVWFSLCLLFYPSNHERLDIYCILIIYLFQYIRLKYNCTPYQRFKLILIVFVYCFYCSYLHNNKITAIKPDTFSNLPNLKHL